MKVVLSRKGMDSENGGIPSPIIQSKEGYWKFYSLPIPTENSDIKYDELCLFDDVKVSKFIEDLGLKGRKYEYCHLDPDIRESYLNKRPIDWKRCFGQVKSAQTHLENNQIGVGDVFLFFGWFKKAEYNNGMFKYIADRDYPNGFHAIYSYLQINEIYKPNIQKTPTWLNYHPHVKYKNETEFNNANNTIYVATEFINYPKHFNKNGSISFVFSEDLILTKKRQPNRTLWELPMELHPNSGVKLSYNASERWGIENNNAILKSASKGQEFVFSDVEANVEKWCINLIKMHSVSD
jgi:hypothetical protein